MRYYEDYFTQTELTANDFTTYSKLKLTET